MSVHVPSSSKCEIRVKIEESQGGRLKIGLSFSPGVGKYFDSDTFLIKYDKIIDKVDESILYVPVIANIAPVAWATGADIHVKVLDRTFVDALDKIKDIVKGMFPGFSCAGRLCVENVVENRFNNSGSAQLFTGGIDSLATYARHRDEKPDLIALDIFKPYSPSLQNTIGMALREFAEKEGVAFHRIESNLNYALFNQKQLLKDYGQWLHEPSWWASVQHGLGLLGMCAPLTAVCDIKQIYIASSATRSMSQSLTRPWGSHPLIDGNVAWADVKAVHDGVEWTRQEKIEHAIKPFIESTGASPPVIVCDDPHRGDILNCNRCEKCSRTIVGLALEGIDPNRCGFKVDDRTFASIKRKLLWDRLMFAYKKSGMWNDIRGAIPDHPAADLYGSKAFFEWLRTHEFQEKWGMQKPLSQKILQKCLKLGIIP